MRAGKLAERDDLARLADLYLANEQWIKSAEILRQLQEAYPGEMRYATIYIRQSIKHDDLHEAERCLPPLLKKWPHHAEAVLLQAELLLRQEKYDDALELMKNIAADPQGQPADRGQRMLATVRRMEEFIDWLKGQGQSGYADRFAREAEFELRQFVDEHPGTALQLATFLSKQERYEDAADVLERYWKSAPRSISHRSLRWSLAAARARRRLVDRVLRVLYRAQSQFLNNDVIPQTIADLYLGAGMYADAETMYRQILKRNPRYVNALNNLAVLLTFNKTEGGESLALIDRAIEIAGPLPALLDTRACVYLARGEADKALADLAEVLADAKKPERLFHLAEAFELAGQARNAALAMKEALDKGLSEKSLFEPETAAFRRLQKLVQELPPEKEDDSAPPLHRRHRPLPRPIKRRTDLQSVLSAVRSNVGQICILSSAQSESNVGQICNLFSAQSDQT